MAAVARAMANQEPELTRRANDIAVLLDLNAESLGRAQARLEELRDLSRQIDQRHTSVLDDYLHELGRTISSVNVLRVNVRRLAGQIEREQHA